MAPTLLKRSIVYFNSNHSLVQTNPSSFTIYMDPDNLVIMQSAVYYKIWIASASLINDVDDVNNANHNLIINGVTYQLPQGKPTIDEIVTELNGFGCVCSYDKDANYLVFGAPVTLDFTVTNSCAELLGFVSGQVYSLSAGDYAPKPVYLGQHDVFYITSNLPVYNYELFGGDVTQTNIMAQIPNIANRFEPLAYNDPDGQYAVIERSRKFINVLSFTITDETNTQLSLNSPWFASIIVENYIDYEEQLLQSLSTLNQNVIYLQELERRHQVREELEKRKQKEIKMKKREILGLKK